MSWPINDRIFKFTDLDYESTNYRYSRLQQSFDLSHPYDHKNYNFYPRNMSVVDAKFGNRGTNTTTKQIRLNLDFVLAEDVDATTLVDCTALLKVIFFRMPLIVGSADAWFGDLNYDDFILDEWGTPQPRSSNVQNTVIEIIEIWTDTLKLNVKQSFDDPPVKLIRPDKQIYSKRYYCNQVCNFLSATSNVTISGTNIHGIIIQGGNIPANTKIKCNLLAEMFYV